MGNTARSEIFNRHCEYIGAIETVYNDLGHKQTVTSFNEKGESVSFVEVTAFHDERLVSSTTRLVEDDYDNTTYAMLCGDDDIETFASKFATVSYGIAYLTKGGAECRYLDDIGYAVMPLKNIPKWRTGSAGTSK